MIEWKVNDLVKIRRETSKVSPSPVILVRA